MTATHLRLVLVESPFAARGPAPGRGLCVGDAELNLQYAQALCRFIALRGDAPYASHLLLTRFLDDSDERERRIGIESGLAWGKCAALTVVGVDRGISKGMRYGIDRARAECRPVEWVSLPKWRESWLPTGVARDEWIDLFAPVDQVVRDV